MQGRVPRAEEASGAFRVRVKGSLQNALLMEVAHPERGVRCN